MRELEILSSPIEAFLSDSCVIDADAFVERDTLYRTYKSWCSDAGYRASSKETFGRDLAAALPNLTRSQRTINGRRASCYSGVDIIRENRRGSPLLSSVPVHEPPNQPVQPSNLGKNDADLSGSVIDTGESAQ